MSLIQRVWCSRPWQRGFTMRFTRLYRDRAVWG